MLINRLLHFLLAHHDHHLMRCSSSVVNPTVVTALLIMPFYIASDKEYLKKRHIILDTQIQHSLSYIV